MYSKLHPQPKFTLSPLSSKTLILPIFNRQFTPIHLPTPRKLSLNHHRSLRLQFRCAANSGDVSVGGTGGGGGDSGIGILKKLEKWLPHNFFSADSVLRLIAGATSSPIGQFISSPITFLHSVDPRIKLVWLFALVVVPARSNIITRFGVVICLAILSIWIQPRPVWMDQLGRLSLLCGVLFMALALGTDGAPSLIQSRNPPAEITGLPNIRASLKGYSYLIIKGPVQLTRKGLSAANTAACLYFTIFQSANLCLSTTTPEQFAYALQWFMLPLANFGVPVAEIILTLLLSLRFISLVFDEVRNVALGILSRRINWKELPFEETINIFVAYINRIFKNIYSHAEQISQAMIVRGFRGDCKSHKIYFPSYTSSTIANLVSMLCLVGFIGVTALSESALI